MPGARLLPLRSARPWHNPGQPSRTLFISEGPWQCATKQAKAGTVWFSDFPQPHLTQGAPARDWVVDLPRCAERRAELPPLGTVRGRTVFKTGRDRDLTRFPSNSIYRTQGMLYSHAARFLCGLRYTPGPLLSWGACQGERPPGSFGLAQRRGRSNLALSRLSKHLDFTAQRFRDQATWVIAGIQKLLTLGTTTDG
jgi:hypothetical protein